MRHKKFLRSLEKQKNYEKDGQIEDMMNAQAKTKAFKEQAARQREKIKGLKSSDVQGQNEDFEDVYVPEINAKPQPLTAENLESHARSVKSSKPSVASKKGGRKGPQRPAWAQTEGMVEENKEAEIDELLEFAYELDYEKYMEDYEVR